MCTHWKNRHVQVLVPRGCYSTSGLDAALRHRLMFSFVSLALTFQHANSRLIALPTQRIHIERRNYIDHTWPRASDVSNNCSGIVQREKQSIYLSPSLPLRTHLHTMRFDALELVVLNSKRRRLGHG
jgi:hypothetical protein